MVNGPYTCEDGTEGKTGTGVGWSRNGGPVLTDQHLELSKNWGVIAFMVSGRLGSHGGSGSLEFLSPALTADEKQAQVCDTGELTWSVERTAGGGFRFKPAVTVEGVGGRTLTMGLRATRSEGTNVLARAEARPTRNFRGRTSQGLALAARTRRTDTGIALLYLSSEYQLACDDGTEIRGGSNPLVVSESTVVMPPGRIDLDLAPAFVGFEAFHMHGELDAHSGFGTIAVIWPFLTEDLQAQVCKSGDLTWELWRTDAGY